MERISRLESRPFAVCPTRVGFTHEARAIALSHGREI